MALPAFTMSELLGAGVHFGHRSFRWNPRLKSYIFGTRNGIHVIDLQQTVPLLYTAIAAVEATAARGGRVLFVGTRANAQQVVKEAALNCGQYYINHRWLGGLLTNWKTVGKSIKRLQELDAGFKASAAAQSLIAEMQAKATPEQPADISGVKDPIAHLTKKERLMRTREYDNLNRVLGGIAPMAGLPDLIIVLSVKEDKIAVDEAGCLGIPVIGIVDTNADPKGVTYIVPGNDDSTRALSLYARLFTESVQSGAAMHKQMAASQPTAAEGASARGPRAKTQTTVTLSKAAQAAVQADVAAEEAAAAPSVTQAAPQAAVAPTAAATPAA